MKTQDIKEQIMEIVRNNPPQRAVEVFALLENQGIDRSKARRALHSLLDQHDLKVTIDWKIQERPMNSILAVDQTAKLPTSALAWGESPKAFEIDEGVLEAMDKAQDEAERKAQAEIDAERDAYTFARDDD